jgi:integrase
MLFHEFATKWIASQTFKHSTVISYTKTLAYYINPVIGDREIHTVCKMDLDNLKKELETKVGSARVNQTVSLLRTVFAAAEDNNLVVKNPAAKLKPVKNSKKQIQPLTLDEVKAALSVVEPTYRPIFTFLAQTGARPCEALALHWNDVDFVNCTIRIDGGRVDEFEAAPKSAAGFRTVVMPPTLAAILLALPQGTPDDYVFVHKHGKPLNGGHLSRTWQQALKAAGIESDTTAYMLRHSFISNAIQHNVDTTFISRSVGHSNVSITLSVYNRLIRSTVNTESEKLSKLMG